MRPEFQELNDCFDSLRFGYINNTIFGSAYLLRVRNLLEACDSLKASRFEGVVLFETYGFWEKCRQLWLEYKAMTDTENIPPLKLRTKKSPDQRIEEPNTAKPLLAKQNQSLAGPNKRWEEVLTLNDREFLRLLRIAPGNKPIYPEDDKKDKDT